MLDFIVEKAMQIWDFCLVNKKKSLLTFAIFILSFVVFGYFSLVILMKIIMFALSFILSLIGLYLKNWIVTIPITLFGLWWYKK